MSKSVTTQTRPRSKARNSRTPIKQRKASTSSNAGTVGCLFSAIGGFAMAFQQAKAKILWANERDASAMQTFRHNFPKIDCCIHKPIEELSVVGDGLAPVDILTAGFPCQPFSVAGMQRGFEDDRGILFLEIIRLLKEFGRDKPQILLLENVANFRAHDDGRTFRRVQREIQQAGYWFTAANAAVLNTATHTSIPQNRARLFMVAMNCDYFARNTFRFPKPRNNHKVTSVWKYIDRRRKPDDWYYFTETSQYHQPFVDAMDKFGNDSIYQLRRNYVRDNKSGLCFTLMANMGEGGHNQPVIRDRWGIRKLTEIECARLQGYDDSSFSFPDEVAITQRYKQIGNSVTVPLVKQLAEQCVELCKSTRPPR